MVFTPLHRINRVVLEKDNAFDKTAFCSTAASCSALHAPLPALSQKLLLSLAQWRDGAAETQAVTCCIAETTNWSDIAKKERKRLTQNPLRRNGANDCTQNGQSDPLSKG